MAPTEGRVARPERRWDCRRGTPKRLPDTGWVSSMKSILYTGKPVDDVVHSMTTNKSQLESNTKLLTDYPLQRLKLSRWLI